MNCFDPGNFDTIPRWATHTPGIPPYARLLLVTLITHDWPDASGKRKQYVTKSQRELSKMLEINRGTVRAALTDLERLGLVRIEETKLRTASRVHILYGTSPKIECGTRGIPEEEEYPDEPDPPGVPGMACQTGQTERRWTITRASDGMPSVPGLAYQTGTKQAHTKNQTNQANEADPLSCNGSQSSEPEPSGGTLKLTTQGHFKTYQLVRSDLCR